MTIKIDQNVPIPARENRKYPFKQMEIGESFFVPGKISSDLSTAIYRPKKFTFRTTIESGVKGVRVWRIE